MNKKPNKWLAAVLSVFVQPLGLLYVARPWWAAFYFVVTITASLLAFAYGRALGAWAYLFWVPLIASVVHAFRAAARFPADAPRPWYSRWYGLLIVVAAYVAVVLLGRSFVGETYLVNAGSMQPTYERGGILWTQKWGYGNYGTFGVSLMHGPITAPLARGDVIVFEFPFDRSERHLKRLIGLPGDEISYRHHVLSVNQVEVPAQRSGEYVEPGKPLVHPRFVESLFGREYAVIFDPQDPRPLPQGQDFVRRDQCSFYADGLTCRLPAGYYFVLGDNRDSSFDSRTFGLVPADHIVGKVIDVKR
jgi:signal peptidase I